MPARKSGLAVVNFVGELNIRSATDLHARLLESVSGAPGVRANIASDATVDLTFVQLIESGRRTAAANGCDFRLAAPAEGQLLETLERGGFLASPEQRDFWLMQSEDR